MKESFIAIVGNRGTPLAVVGSNLMFLNVSAGFPGSMHDYKILKNSPLFHEAEEGNILSNPTDVIEKTKVGPV